MEPEVAAGVHGSWTCDASPDGLAEAVRRVVVERGYTLGETSEDGRQISFRTSGTRWTRELLCDARIQAEGSGSRLELAAVADAGGSTIVLGRSRSSAVVNAFLDQVAAKV